MRIHALLLRLPVHDDRTELPVPQVVENNGILLVGQPERHCRLLKIPASRRRERNEPVAVLHIDDSERTRSAFRKPFLDVGLEYERVTVVGAPRIDGVVAREEMILRSLRYRPGTGELGKFGKRGREGRQRARYNCRYGEYNSFVRHAHHLNTTVVP